jgi:UDP-3-O-[3-hydroxymyristoyl] glucosamine N-acyltransferase
MNFLELVAALGESAANNSLASNPECNPPLVRLMSIEAAVAGDASYIEGGKFASHVETTAAAILILPNREDLTAAATKRGIAWIAGNEPRLLFAEVINILYRPASLKGAIDPTATIDPTAEIGENVAIGARAWIGAGVKLGDSVQIWPNVVVYPGTTIGDRSVLHANCTIQERTQIGKDCVIHSGATIGSEGFGFVPTHQGWYKMQQSGCVVLEDGVEVGANSCIDRPAIGETRVGCHTKIDNLVHVAHGCTIGSNCALAAQVGLAGGVKVGNGVLLGGQVGAANNVTIGDGVQASAKTGIHGNVSPGEVISGYPAMPHRVWLKSSAIIKQLPEIYSSWKKLL